MESTERYSDTLQTNNKLTSLFGSILLGGLFMSVLLEVLFLTDAQSSVPSFPYLVLSGLFVGGFLIAVYYKQPYASCYPLTVAGMCFVIIGILLQFPLTLSFALGVTLFMSLTGISQTLSGKYI